MKKSVFLISAVLFSFIAFGQLKPATNWIMGQPVQSNNYYQIVKQLDAFWASNPAKNNKGSGYKVYQRWKEYWQYYLNEDSTLMTGEQMANEYNLQRKKPSLNKAADSLDNSNWIPLGPFTHQNIGSWSAGQGRVNVSLVDPNNPNTIYIGSPNGGLWRSIDNGDSWEILTEGTLISGVSGIAVDYANSNIIYVSTGDEDTDENPSVGIFKSINGGKTWIQTGFPTNISKIGEIFISPTNSNMLWVVSSGGIYKSIDAGVSWVRKYNFVSRELRLKPDDENTIYAVSQTGTTATILKSTNAGESFSSIQTYSNAGRTMIDVTPANPNYLYVLVSNSNKSFKGLYRSTNSGTTFTTQNASTDIYDGATQSDYDLALAVSPQDANLVYTGCLNIWKSTNGGVNFSRVNSWSNPNTVLYTHADIHDLKFFNGKLYAGTDGGIYLSNETLTSFSDKTKNGLNISQFYRIDVAQSKQASFAGGLQDNGGYSFANNAWINYHGADGMDAAIDPTDINLHYGFIQYGGSLYAINTNDLNTGGSFAASGPENGNWITPLEFGNNGTLYAGYSMLYYFKDRVVFEPVSSKIFQNNIKHIRVHPSNDLKVLVSDESRLFLSDGTEAYNFQQLNSLPIGNLKSFDFNRNTPQIIYAMSNNGIYKSENEGLNWVNITYNLPVGSKNALVHQASSYNNTIYVATNKSVYYTNDSLKEWKLFSTNLPNSTITDIEVNNVENHLVISTYGRGVWRCPVASESLKVQIIPNDSDTAINHSAFLYPNPVKDIAYLSTTINEPLEIKVFGTNGQMVLNLNYPNLTPNTPLNFSNLATGVYVFNLVSPKHLITQKFIKY